MNVKRLMLILSFILLEICTLSAATHLTIELNTWEKISFTLADKPIITFGNGELIINGDAETSYAIRDIKGYYFTEDKDNGIENQLANKLRIIKIDENTIQVQNANVSTKVSLVGSSGIVLSTMVVDASGNAIISIPQEKGVYILTVADKSLKIIKK